MRSLKRSKNRDTFPLTLFFKSVSFRLILPAAGLVRAAGFSCSHFSV